jgi:sec-independent protein translocase protein TatA
MFEGLFTPAHLLIILVIVLIIFGPGKLPQIGAELGKGIRALKKALSEEEKHPIQETKAAAAPKKETVVTVVENGEETASVEDTVVKK